MADEAEEPSIKLDSSFVESDHPRDTDGKFGSGGGGGKSSLSAAEKSYLSSYSGDDFLRVNKALRAGDSSDPAVKRIEKAIDKSAPIPAGTKLYRGMSMEAAKKLFPDGKIDNGMTISDRAFLSTSKDEEEGRARSRGGVMLKIETGDSAAGLDMEKHSSNKHEQEVLLPRDAKMTVVGLTAPKRAGDPVIVRVKYGDAQSSAKKDSLTPKGVEILDAMRREYGDAKGEKVFYAARNAGTIKGVDEERDAVPPGPVEPIYSNAAGVLFVADDGSALLMHRTDGQGWAFPGGGIEAGETAEEAARREVLEETGLDYKGPLRLHTRRIDGATDFTTFIALGVEKFIPQMNSEHDGFQWRDRKAALTDTALQMHPGAVVALARPDMNELDIAKAIASGELVSPQLFGNTLLVAMRVTGTGASHRSGPADEPDPEFVYRDPALYLNDEFLQRCAGLFVMVEHPEGDEGGRMTSDEYRADSVGAAFYSYIKGDEVWTIAKIIDTAAIEMLLAEQLSTSPGVIFVKTDPGEEFVLPDGSKLLIEVTPRQLDHLAICRRGVWDKGGSPAGIDTTGVQTMAGENTEGKMDAAAMKRFDEACARMDASAARMDSLSEAMKAKKDADEKEAADKAKKDADEAEAKAKKDAEEAEVAVKAKKDAEEKEAESQAKKDAERDAELKSLRETVAGLSARAPAQLNGEDRAKYATHQMEAERVAQAFGRHDGAPGPMQGELLKDYRVRLATGFKSHSPSWKDVDLALLDEKAMGVAEAMIYKDAFQVAANPKNEPGAPLRGRTRVDESGRRITEFSGDPVLAWAPFVGKGVRYLTGINRKPAGSRLTH